MRATSSWRITSCAVNATWPMPSTLASSRVASARPEIWPCGRSTWLGSPVTIMRLFSPSRVRNIFICIEVVFCASSRITTAFDSVRPRMKASGAISISPACSARSTMRAVHQVVERVVDRPQIGIDLLAHVAGQEAEPLAGLDRRPRQDDAVDLLALEQLHRMRDREPGLAGAGGAGAEHQRMPPQRADIGVLRGRAGAHRALAQIDLLEARPRGRRIVVEQRALRDREPDRALDVAGDELVAALEPLVEALEHAARLLDGVARALERDLIAALLGDDAEPALDQREVLAVLAEQQRGEAIVVEGEHDLGGGVCRRRHRRPRASFRCPTWSCATVLSLLLPPSSVRSPCAGAAASVAEQAVGADLGDRHRRDLADHAIAGAMTCTGCRYGERPTIWPG